MNNEPCQLYILIGCYVLNALTFGAGVVIAISFQQVDTAPYAERAAERHNEGLESADCRVEEIHIFTFFS